MSSTDLVAKVSYTGTLRQITVPHPAPKWVAFEDNLRRIHGIPSNRRVSVTYKDEDGDVIAIDTDTELEELVRVARARAVRSIRFDVQTTGEEIQQLEKQDQDEWQQLDDISRTPSPVTTPAVVASNPFEVVSAETTEYPQEENEPSLIDLSALTIDPPAPQFPPGLPIPAANLYPEVPADENDITMEEVDAEPPVPELPEARETQTSTDSKDKGKQSEYPSEQPSTSGASSAAPDAAEDPYATLPPYQAFTESIKPILDQIQSEVAAHPEFFQKIGDLAGQIGQQAQTHLPPLFESLSNQFNGAQQARGPAPPGFTGPPPPPPPPFGGFGGLNSLAGLGPMLANLASQFTGPQHHRHRGPHGHHGGPFGFPFGGAPHNPYGFPHPPPGFHHPHQPHHPHHQPHHPHPHPHPHPQPTPEGPAVWPNVICDGCDTPLTGPRFRCTTCPDFDLCATCHAKIGTETLKHDVAHVFDRRERPTVNENWRAGRCGRGAWGGWGGRGAWRGAGARGGCGHRGRRDWNWWGEDESEGSGVDEATKTEQKGTEQKGTTEETEFVHPWATAGDWRRGRGGWGGWGGERGGRCAARAARHAARHAARADRHAARAEERGWNWWGEMVGVENTPVAPTTTTDHADRAAEPTESSAVQDMKLKLEELRSMGFLDERENRELLERYEGNLSRVVEVLLQRG